MKTKVLLVGFLASLSTGTFAQDSYTTSDVVGMFANQNFIGSESGTKTVVEAHLLCIGGSGTVGGDKTANEVGQFNYDNDYNEAYRQCMSKYVPFRVTGSDSEGACGSQSVTWGQCSSNLPASADGAIYSARNSSSDGDFEGVATFQCENQSWKYVSGGCSKIANPCDDGLVTSWEVTTPLWADSSAETVFTDRFGQIRHNPKEGCYARLDAANSGELRRARATSPETSPDARYDMANSSSPKRCFNNEWLDDPTGGGSSCRYIPRSCSAQTYTHPNGCSYSIPALGHDQVYNSSNPSPSKSVGSLQAYCWDGQVEIKSASCNMSCEGRVPTNYWSWDGADQESNPKSCYHPAKFESGRIAPTGGMNVNNTTEGLQGSSFYTCNNGEMKLDSENCAPINCTSVPANSWSEGGQVCAHDAFVVDIPHGERVSKRPLDIGMGTEGEIVYQCNYGELSVISKSCTQAYQASICYAEEVNPDDPSETSEQGYLPPPSSGEVNPCDPLNSGDAYLSRYDYVNGQCCTRSPGRNLMCYEIP